MTDYTIVSVAALGFAIFCAAKLYGFAASKAGKLAGWAGAACAFLFVFAVGSAFSDYILKSECAYSHDPAACVLDAQGDD